MFIMFILFSQVVVGKYWILKLFVWKSGRQQEAGRSMLKCCYHFFSRTVSGEKKGESNYTRAHCSCKFHSWALGTSNRRVFSQPSSGNCNLFVLMLFPPGPAFKIAYIWFWISFILPCYKLSSPSYIFPVGRFFVSWLGLWDVLRFWWQVFTQGCGGWTNLAKFMRKL